MGSKIPLVDLRVQYETYKEEFDAAIKSCLDQTAFIGGSDHSAFSEEFSRFCGGGFTALCGNGTDALYLSILEYVGRGSGKEEIITVAHTFIATAEAITMAGYRPVFVDIDPEYYLIDVSLIEKAITPMTRAILPVHIYGQMAQMDKITSIGNRYELKIVEDAAQAHGARWKNRCSGKWDDVACFSFYPGKNLGAWGDGGAVFSENKDLISRIKMRANHGRKSKYEHQFEGTNSRLDGLQAAVLRVKLQHLEEWTEMRRTASGWYRELLSEVPSVKCPVEAPEAKHVYHLFVIEVDDRDRVLSELNRMGIGAGIHYPVPLCLQPAYSYMNYSPGSLPVTEEVAGKIISLPIYPEITFEQVETVVDALKTVMEKGR